jgi:hypothetical protein
VGNADGLSQVSHLDSAAGMGGHVEHLACGALQQLDTASAPLCGALLHRAVPLRLPVKSCPMQSTGISSG